MIVDPLDRQHSWDYADRAPTQDQAYYNGVNVAPHSGTLRDTYTPSSGRLAMICGGHIQIHRKVAASSAGLAYASVELRSGATPICTLAYLLVPYTNTIGDSVLVPIQSGLIFDENIDLKVFTGDGSTGGNIDYSIQIAVMEFDA